MEVRRRNRLPQQQDDRRDGGDSAHQVYVAGGIHLREIAKVGRHLKLPRFTTRIKAPALAGIGRKAPPRSKRKGEVAVGTHRKHAATNYVASQKHLKWTARGHDKFNYLVVGQNEPLIPEHDHYVRLVYVHRRSVMGGPHRAHADRREGQRSRDNRSNTCVACACVQQRGELG